MSIQIDKGIPIVDRKTKTGFAAAVRFLEIGDSFLLPAKSSIQTCRGQLSTIGRLTGRKFTTRMTPDGLRIWRIS